MRHPPETLKDVFLPQGDIVQRTVDGVLLFRFSILVPSNDFQLRPLTLLAQSDHYPEMNSYHSSRIRQPHEHPTFPGRFPCHLATKLS